MLEVPLRWHIPIRALYARVTRGIRVVAVAGAANLLPANGKRGSFLISKFLNYLNFKTTRLKLLVSNLKIGLLNRGQVFIEIRKLQV